MTELRKDTLLDALLPHIIFDGWSDTALKRAAEEIGGTIQDAKRLFPRGGIDALLYFLKRADTQMVEALTNNYTLETMKIRERIATGVIVRFEQNATHKDAIKRGLAMLSLPWYAADGLKALYNTADEIWHAAGDTSTDFNFYTKRGLLAKVYMSTLLFWLNDTSDNMEATRAFLHRRIENVMQIQKLKGKLQQFCADLVPNDVSGKAKTAEH